MMATHYSPRKSPYGAACGQLWAEHHTADVAKVDCLRCRSTNAFPGKRIPNIMKEAHRMAAAGGYGFLGTSGMKSYNERLSLALIHLGRNR